MLYAGPLAKLSAHGTVATVAKAAAENAIRATRRRAVADLFCM
jgi:hypothetical protein